ncbi:MAG: oligosaccharide flippase family protein [Phascolarctobacterium sp.]|nr:oligosaccharide flippase family protein [Phascolarctobacterium sp.]
MNERRIGILISYLNIVLHAVIGFAYVPILLHYIGKSEYGLYQLIGSFIAYFSIMDFGLTAAVVRFYAKYKALQDQIKMENILAFAMRAYGVITALMLVSGVGFYFYLPSIFAKSMTVAEIESAKQLFILLLFNIVVTISTMIFRAVINAHEKFLFLKGLETIQLVLQPLLVVLVLQKLPSAMAVAMVQTLLNVALIAARMYYCFQKLHIKIRYHYWDAELFDDFKKLALSVFAVTLIDQVFFKTNQVILGIVSGTVAVAVYSIASLIYMNYMALSTAISGVYLPHITELIAQQAPVSKLSDLFIRIGRLQFFLLALVASGFVIFGKQFIKMWAGESFIDAYFITLLIIIPFTIDLIQNIGLAIMQAQNRYDFRAKVYCAMGILNLFLAIPLAIKHGGIGCAFATGLAMFLGNGLIMNWYYVKVTGLDITRFWREIGKICAVVIVITILGNSIYNMLKISESKLIFGLSILVYSSIYLIVLYITVMNQDEKDKITSIIKRIGIIN